MGIFVLTVLYVYCSKMLFDFLLVISILRCKTQIANMKRCTVTLWGAVGSSGQTFPQNQQNSDNWSLSGFWRTRDPQIKDDRSWELEFWSRKTFEATISCSLLPVVKIKKINKVHGVIALIASFCFPTKITFRQAAIKFAKTVISHWINVHWLVQLT